MDTFNNNLGPPNKAPMMMMDPVKDIFKLRINSEQDSNVKNQLISLYNEFKKCGTEEELLTKLDMSRTNFKRVVLEDKLRKYIDDRLPKPANSAGGHRKHRTRRNKKQRKQRKHRTRKY